MLGRIYDFFVIAFISGIFFIVYKIWKYFYNIMRLPPGPTGLPFLGVVNKLDPNKVRETLQEWKEKYGDIYSFTLAGQHIVVVSSYELIKEVLLTRSEEFAGRPQSFRVNAIVDFNPVLGVASDCPKIRLIKKTLNTSLKMYGERLLKLEELSVQAIQEMTEHWKSMEGKPFDPQPSIHDAVGKIITALTWGKEMTKDQFEENLVLQNELNDVVAPGGVGQDRFDGENPECVLHAVSAARNRVNKENGEREVLSEIDVNYIGQTLIGAGTGTTFRATHSFVAILTNKPELQKRLQQEVDKAVGDETPRLADKDKMPYMEATVYELLRYISHVPILIPHAAMKDTTLGGYSIPKDTQVWINAFGLHHDPRYWDDPWEFKPERYLDENGQLIPADHPNRRRLLAFGAGRLVCSGEVLAKNRMFLIMSGIVQNFTFKPKSEAEKPKSDPRDYIPGFIINPQDYELVALPRKKIDQDSLN